MNIGYIKRNANGVKEIREGDVMPEWSLNYGQRHSMSASDWGYYWDAKIAWDTANIIKVHPALYWAFPEDGKIEYGIFNGFAIPTNIAPIILLPSDRVIGRLAMHMRMERFLYPEDGGYRARRNREFGL